MKHTIQKINAPQNHKTTPHNGRLEDLRNQIARHKCNGFLIPRNDAYQGEYIPAADARLEWLTGFSGSAGLAIVLKNTAALFVDGRYILQAPQQVNTRAYKIINIRNTTPQAWLKKHAPDQKIGFDPRLHTHAQCQQMQQDGIKIKAIANPIDAIWHDRPSAPQSTVKIFSNTRAGANSADKRKAITQILRKNGADYLIITAPENIAWLLNIRGNDVPHTPLILAFAVLEANRKCHWFISKTRTTPKIRAHLGRNVRLHPPEKLPQFLENLKGTIQYDPQNISVWLQAHIKKHETIEQPDPITLPKACKTNAELRGMRNAHIRDGLALTKFLYWLEQQISQKKPVDEISAAQQLEAYRAAHRHLRGLSFDTISATGANGAIVHYRVTTATNRRLKIGELYLVDSGGQYVDGTTDVTRTVLIGNKPSADTARAFTAVLRGHIALARAQFPHGTSGAQLDAIARAPLWEEGLDFAHGTGHGVGAYLSVHEGPQQISKSGTIPLKTGMIVSNEPGYYRPQKFGIRIENLQYVVASTKGMLGFRMLTRAPIDRRLILRAALTQYERQWLDGYHAEVYARLAPHLPPKMHPWLGRQCAPI